MTIEEDYRPTTSEDYMNPQQLRYFERHLKEWRRYLVEKSRETLEQIENKAWHKPDDLDVASMESETSFELRTSERYRKLIIKIDQALLRINDGSYGYCKETGDEIGIERLMARPITTLSLAAQERHEAEEAMNRQA